MQKNIGKFILQQMKENELLQEKAKRENRTNYENSISFLITGKPATGKTYFFDNEFLKSSDINDYETFKFNCFDLQENFEEKMLEQIFKDNGSLRFNSLKWWHKLAIKQYNFCNSFWKIIFLPILLGFIIPTLISIAFEAYSNNKVLFWWMTATALLFATLGIFISCYCLIINFFFLKLNTITNLKKILKKDKKYIYIFDDLDRVDDFNKRDYILKEINLLKIYLNENKIGKQNIFIIITNNEDKIQKEWKDPFAHSANTINEGIDSAIRNSAKSLFYVIYDIFDQKINYQNKKINEKYYDFYLCIEETQFQKQETIFLFFQKFIKKNENILLLEKLIKNNFSLLLEQYNLRDLKRMIEIINTLTDFFNKNQYLIKRFFPKYLDKIFYFSLIFSFFPEEFWIFIQNTRNSYSNFKLQYNDEEIEFAITLSEMFILFQFLTVKTNNEYYENIKITELIRIANSFDEDEIYIYEILNICGKNLLSNTTFKIFLEPLLNSFNFKKITNVDSLYKLKLAYPFEDMIWESIIKFQNFNFVLKEKGNIVNLSFDDLNKETFINQIFLLKFIWSKISVISKIQFKKENNEETIKVLSTQEVGVFDFLENIRLISRKSMFFKEDSFQLQPNINSRFNYDFLITYINDLKKENTHYSVISKVLFVIFNLNNDFVTTQEKNFAYLYLTFFLQEINDHNLNSYIICLLNKKEIRNLIKEQIEMHRKDNFYIINQEAIKILQWLLNLKFALIEQK